ncbi:unnamed protein product [Didymodactylos carnosus]|uniref:Uncharacterized protein n=1 Tax=Didymodactylos carnosus TaxID=1234261 RepID=A0A8S2EJM1_9BILA|nr:unnamed protein product [Didymodactylos carnosus]CAF4003095.1 unnamed protein product [Didymodactylos carnosus]
MSNSRQFLLPSNYDEEKKVYNDDDIVRKRQYSMDDLFQQHSEHKEQNKSDIDKFYSDKLGQRAEHR